MGEATAKTQKTNGAFGVEDKFSNCAIETATFGQQEPIADWSENERITF